MLSDYAAKRMTFLIPRRLFSKGRRSVQLGNPGFRTNGLKLFAFAPKKRAFSERQTTGSKRQSAFGNLFRFFPRQPLKISASKLETKLLSFK